MKEIWKYFEEHNSISKKDYINYIIEILNREKNLKHILLIIYKSKNGVHIQKILDFKHEKVSFSERTATRQVKLLYNLGLITLSEEIGPVKRYKITSLGKDVLKETGRRKKQEKIKGGITT